MIKPVISEVGKPKAVKRKPTAKNRIKRKTRQEQLKALLSRKSGATVGHIQSTFGWQPHSVRAAISGLRKAGANIENIQTTKGTSYRVVSGGAGK